VIFPDARLLNPEKQVAPSGLIIMNNRASRIAQ